MPMFRRFYKFYEFLIVFSVLINLANDERKQTNFTKAIDFK